jgi:Negative regulator of sigma F
MKQVSPECGTIDRLVEDRLLNGVVQMPAPSRRHLDECSRCRELYRTFDSELPEPPVSREIEHRITQALKSNLKPVSPLPAPRWIALALVAVFLSVSIAIITRLPIAGIQVMSLVQTVGVSAFLLVGIAFLAVSLARQMRPGSSCPMSKGSLLALLIPGLGLFVAVLFPWRMSGDFVDRGWQCLRAGLMLALPAGLLLGYAISRGAPLDLNWIGATAGATAGWLGLTVLQYTCNLQNAGHLLVWHLGVVLLSTLAGAAIGHMLGRTLCSS